MVTYIHFETLNPLQDKAYLSWKNKYQLEGFEILVVETTE